jgi:triphosphatase
MTEVEPLATTELGLRFTLPADARSALEAHAAFQPARATAADTIRQVTTYFDTADRALALKGVSLRIRRCGEEQVQTTQWQPQGSLGAFARCELDRPVASDKPDLAFVAELTATTALQGAPRGMLRPAFVTDVECARRYLLPAPDAVVEAVIGEGTLLAGARHEPVRELELGLKAGRPAQLYRLALDLHASVPLALSVEGENGRGQRLAAGTAPEARHAEEVCLQRDISLAEGFRQILAAAHTHLLANQPAASAGSADGVHQMRIAVRRLRSAIALFAPHLDPERVVEIDGELRRLGRSLGEVRDWDVFCGSILQAAEQDIPEAAPRLLRGPARAQRDDAQHRLAEVLEGPAFTSLALRLALWTEEQAARMSVDNAPDRLSSFAPELLSRLLRKARRRGRHIRRRPVEELHSLRKSLKRLRYSVEFLSGVIDRKRSHAYLKACKALQEGLGTINDAALAMQLTDRLAGAAARMTLVPALSAMPDWSREHGVRHVQRLPKAWKGFKNLPALTR